MNRALLVSIAALFLLFHPQVLPGSPLTPKPLPARVSSLSDKTTIEAEIRSRAERYLAQQQLIVDYYRIGRRLAFQIPMEGIVEPQLEVPGIPDYPWEIWLSWELEERLNCLSWTAQWFNDQKAATEAARELQLLAGWSSWTPNHRLDLCLGHISRTLWQAYTKWTWLEPPVRQSVGLALDRLAAQSLPWVKEKYGSLEAIQKAGTQPDAHTRVHNIPFIGLIGATLAANARQSGDGPFLNERIQALLALLFQLRQRGYSEGVAYDGYLLDFLACWLESLPPALREQILKTYDFRSFFNESCSLAAPGEMVQVAEIADVEPTHMPFHLSAQARLQQWQPIPERAWYLRRCCPRVLRADALAILHAQADSLESVEKIPPAGILDAQYAMVLRSGWGPDDLAVAIASSTSLAGHIHADGGSITIGTSGRWLIADPGYQQYMPGEEREFTLGPFAHNAPVLNGGPQESKATQILSRGQDTNGAFFAKLDLTRNYPAELGARRIVRTVWLARGRFVVVADQLEGERIKTVTYSWHGDPEAAWRVENGWALLYREPSALWLTSPMFAFTNRQLTRLPGSRGQLTLKVEGSPRPVIWWVFGLGSLPPRLETEAEGKILRLEGLAFNANL